MGALADWSAFLSALTDPQDLLLFSKTIAGAGNNLGRCSSSWLGTPNAGAAPTTAAALTKATVGAYPFDTDGWRNSGGTTQKLCMGGHVGTSLPATIIIADRLSHQGGLSGTVTGAQTTNLPTAALTRYTSGDGVMAALEVYTAVGTTVTTATVSYTNQAGTAGQVSPLIGFGSATNGNGASAFNPIPLAVGDTGVRAVASVTLAASTATAGAFGVTLYKPLAVISVNQNQDDPQDPVLSASMFGGLPELLDDACLFMIMKGSAVASITVGGALAFAEV